MRLTREEGGTQYQRNPRWSTAGGPPGSRAARKSSTATAGRRAETFSSCEPRETHELTDVDDCRDLVTGPRVRRLHQQQWPLGTQMVRDQLPAAAVVGQAEVPPPVRPRGWQTTVLAWMRAGTGGATLVTGGLQKRIGWGCSRGEDWVPAAASTRSTAVPPPEGSSPTLVPRGLQLQASWGPFLTGGRAKFHLLSITGVFGDRPSTRTRSRPRHRSPASSGESDVAARCSSTPGVLGRRQRAAFPPWRVPVHPLQQPTGNLLHGSLQLDVFGESRGGANRPIPSPGAVSGRVHPSLKVWEQYGRGAAEQRRCRPGPRR